MIAGPAATADGVIGSHVATGQITLRTLADRQPGSLVEGDPRESLMRFHVVRRTRVVLSREAVEGAPPVTPAAATGTTRRNLLLVCPDDGVGNLRAPGACRRTVSRLPARCRATSLRARRTRPGSRAERAPGATGLRPQAPTAASRRAMPSIQWKVHLAKQGCVTRVVAQLAERVRGLDVAQTQVVLIVGPLHPLERQIPLSSPGVDDRNTVW